MPLAIPLERLLARSCRLSTSFERYGPQVSTRWKSLLVADFIGPVRRFVVHEHYARSHHFDLRLERDGVLWSWALPKGMPSDPKANRLAVRVEDHDLDHIDFEDPTPVAGAPEGTMAKSIWDHGTYTDVRTADNKLVVDISGQRLQDRYAIFHTGGNNWIVHLMADN